MRNEKIRTILSKEKGYDDDVRAYNEALNNARLETLRHRAFEASREDYFSKRDFYIVLVATNKRTPEREPMDLLFCRRSCPTPGYNQNVFKYHHQTEKIEYLWTIPRKATYMHFLRNKDVFMKNPATQRQLSFILNMESGSLLEWVKRENSEKGLLKDAVIMRNEKPAEA